jgi:CDP-diacylglycerol--serine O-phosphatidyltransferase
MEPELRVIPRRRREDRPSGRLRKGLYILPSLFTAANIAMGYYAILQVTHATATEPWHFDFAAKAIGFAVLFDGLDGRIARMTHTSSDFGRELDSLADVITFGVAPALLAWMWGFRQLPVFLGSSELTGKMIQLGSISSFLFLMAGASRLARFNIALNPQPSNPGRPGKKYFVGMPIPAGAGVIAAVVHFSGGEPISSLWSCITWMLIIVAAGYLMVSTWRFYSFKDIDFRARQPFQLVILLGLLFAAVWVFSQWVLFIIALIRKPCAEAIFIASPSSARLPSRARKLQTCSTIAISRRSMSSYWTTMSRSGSWNPWETKSPSFRMYAPNSSKISILLSLLPTRNPRTRTGRRRTMRAAPSSTSLSLSKVSRTPWCGRRGSNGSWGSL